MTKEISINLLERMAAIFNYSYSGGMVGKGEGEYLKWSELSEPEKALVDEKSYNEIVSIFSNLNKLYVELMKS